MNDHILKSLFVYAILAVHVHCQNDCRDAKYLHNNYYRISSVEDSMTNNEFEYNNIKFVFESKYKMREAIQTSEGRVYQKNDLLYFSPSKTSQEYNIMMKNKKSKFLVLLADEHILYILPEQKIGWKKNLLFSVNVKNYTLHRNKIIPESTYLLLCDLENIATDATKTHIALYGTKGNKHMFTIFEKLPNDPCQLPVHSNVREKLDDLRQYAADMLAAANQDRRQCNVKNRKGAKTACATPLMANFSLKLEAIAGAYNNDIEKTKSNCMASCPALTSSEGSDDGRLTTEIIRLNDKYKLINDKLMNFRTQVKYINQAFKKLSFDSFKEISKNNMQMNFDNKIYECFTGSDLEKLNAAYTTFLADYNDVFDNMSACESEIEEFIKENKPSEIIIT